MKRLLLIVSLFIVGACITGCQKESLEPNVNANNAIVNTPVKASMKNDVRMEKLNNLTADNDARLARLGITNVRANGVQTAIVPDDYATIQEAIDAVNENGNVIVKPGTYNEGAVVIYKQGLKIKAIGNVILNGGFVILENTDDVTIQKFKIDMTNAFYTTGIVGLYANGCTIKQNTVYGSNHIAMYFNTCSNTSITQNNISGETDWGIYIDGYPEFGDPGSCDNNTIAHNTITGITGLYYQPERCAGIEFRANCANNTIMENTVTSSGIGISLFSYGNATDGYASCNNNVVKNNMVKNSLNYGIRIWQGGAYNTIGPNNTSNNNGTVGILIHDIDSNHNFIFNNKALNNSQCDIVNFGTDNTFKNNTATCTSGVD